MENKDVENLEKNKEAVFEGGPEKKEDFLKEEVLEKEIEKLLNTKQKAIEIKKQLEKQQGLSFKLGLKKRDALLVNEFNSLHEDYKKTLKNLEGGGFSIELIAKKELELNIRRKKEEAEKLIQELGPTKTKLFDKIKNIFFPPKEKVKNQYDIPEKISMNLEEEKRKIIESGVADEFLKDHKDRFPQDADNLKEESLPEKPVILEEEQKDQDFFEEKQDPVISNEEQEDISIDGNLAGRYKNFDEEQINKKKKEIEYDLDVKTESFNMRDIPSEEQAKEKYEKIKEEEENEREKIEESMDRPNI